MNRLSVLFLLIATASAVVRNDSVTVSDDCVKSGCPCFEYQNQVCSKSCNSQVCNWDGLDCLCQSVPDLAYVSASSFDTTVFRTNSTVGQTYGIQCASGSDLFAVKADMCNSTSCSISVAVTTSGTADRIRVEVENKHIGASTVSIDGAAATSCCSGACPSDTSCSTFSLCSTEFSGLTVASHTITIMTSSSTACNGRYGSVRAYVVAATPTSSGQFVCTKDSSAAVTAVNYWVPNSACYLACTAQPTFPTNVAGSTCSVPTKHTQSCSSFTCNSNYAKSTGYWYCENGVWTAKGTFCKPVCTSQPSGNNLATATCTSLTSGAICETTMFTCNTGYTPQYTWTCDGDTTAAWRPTSIDPCQKRCTGTDTNLKISSVSTADSNFISVLSTSCSDSDSGVKCNSYTCVNNTIKNPAAAYVCTNGVWVTNDRLCFRPCVTYQSAVTTYVLPLCVVSDTCPIKHGGICGYNCSSGWANSSYLTCYDGSWTNGLCLQGCPRTFADGYVLQYLQGYLAVGNSSFPISGRANTTSAVTCPSGQEFSKLPCSRSMTCGSGSALTWSKAASFGQCYASCSFSDLQALVGSRAIGCASKDGTDTTGWKYGVGDFGRHGTQCDVQCTNAGQLMSLGGTNFVNKTGSPGPYCFNGAWKFFDRMGRRMVPTTCNLLSEPLGRSMPTYLGRSSSNNLVFSSCAAPPTTDFSIRGITLTGFSTKRCDTQFDHGRFFMAPCTNSSYIQRGPNYIQCNNGVWVEGNNTATIYCDAPAVPSATAATCSMSDTYISNMKPSQCQNILQYAYCTPDCKDGYIFSSSRTRSSLNDLSYWNDWWTVSPGAQCISGAFPIVSPFACIPACAGNPNVWSGELEKYSTPGYCDLQRTCDGFCGRPHATTPVDLSIVDCTGPACGWDRSTCSSSVSPTFTVGIREVTVSWASDRELSGGAWIGLYLVGETNPYNFFARRDMNTSNAVGGSITMTVPNLNAINQNRNVSPTPMYLTKDLEARLYADITTNYLVASSRLCGAISPTFNCGSPQSTPVPWDLTEKTMEFEVLIKKEEELALKNTKMAFQTFQAPAAMVYPNLATNVGAIGAATTANVNGLFNTYHTAYTTITTTNVLPPLCLANTNCGCADYGGSCNAACNNPSCNYDAFTCACFAPDYYALNGLNSTATCRDVNTKAYEGWQKNFQHHCLWHRLFLHVHLQAQLFFF